MIFAAITNLHSPFINKDFFSGMQLVFNLCYLKVLLLTKKIIMKELLIAATMLFLTAGVFAQAQPKKEKEKDPKMTVVKKEDKKETAKVVPIAKPATSANPTKKDGTPDKRFKANKEEAKPVAAGPTKKDGTLDKRYKANKDASKKKNG
jgi:hypothetical protein